MSDRKIGDSPSTILPLTSAAVSRIRSTLNITSLPDVLHELIQNALDAEARQIDCWINIERWGVRVSDDGTGLEEEGMRRVAERYASSKASDIPSLSALSTFGFRGEALASIAAISLLEIVSKHESESCSHGKVIKGGELLSCGPTTRFHRTTSGTTVTVKDLFYNIPVRRPPTAFVEDPFNSASYPSSSTILAQSRKILEVAALVFPEVGLSLSIEDDGGVEGVKRLVSIAPNSTVLRTFESLYGKGMTKIVKEVHVSYKNMRIDGFISLTGAYTKIYQFLYVNKFNLKRCELHKVVEQRFSRTSWAVMISEDEKDGSPSRRSPRQVVLKPVYVLSITVPPRDVDVILEPGKKVVGFENWDVVGEFMATTIDEVLRAYGLIWPGADTKGKVAASPAKIAPGGLAMSPRNRKRSHLQRTAEIDNPAISFASQDDPGLRATAGHLCHTESETRDCNASTHEDPLPNDAAVPPWLQTSLLRRDQAVFTPTSHLIPRNKPLDTSIGDVQLPKRVATDITYDTEEASYSRDALKVAIVISQIDNKFICCAVPKTDGTSALIMIDQHAASERIRVEGFLKNVCERFLSDTMNVVNLSPDPHIILLTSQEVTWLRDRDGVGLRIFGRWGISLLLPPPTESSEGLEQVEVYTIPEVVSRRMAGESGKEVKKVVQSYIAYLAQEGTEGLELLLQKPSREDGGIQYGRVVRWCPRRLVELINSKACRGAIMFNDRLSHSQCTSLITELAQTDAPFMCAHGRPSIAPLIQYSTSSAGTKGDRKMKIDWGRV